MANRFILTCRTILKSRTSTSSRLSATSAADIYTSLSPSAITFLEKQLSDVSLFNLDDVKNNRLSRRSIPTVKLLRSALNLHMVAMEPVVDVGMWMMRSKLMTTPLVMEAVLGFVRGTFYEHFCTGESAVEAGESVRELNEVVGLRGMLVYALEYTGDNESCDRNLQGFLDTVESTKSLPAN